MTLLNLVLWLIVCGILWWAVNAIIAILAPYIGEPFMSIIRIVLIVILCFILISAIMQLFGAAHVGLPMIRTF